MTWLHTNSPPVYNEGKPYQDNFGEFFHWALTLKHPMRQIPIIGEELGFGVRHHPLGFMAIYLSRRTSGLHTLGLTGIARANFYPPGVKFAEDIHSHGFDFVSGVAAGVLLHTRHYPDWDTRLAEGEGYIGYETSADAFGQNHTIRATGAVVSIARSEASVLQSGTMYSLKPRVDFHSVEADDSGAVTVFCKTPTYTGQDGQSLMLRKPSEQPPPEVY